MYEWIYARIISEEKKEQNNNTREETTVRINREEIEKGEKEIDREEFSMYRVDDGYCERNARKKKKRKRIIETHIGSSFLFSFKFCVGFS